LNPRRGEADRKRSPSLGTAPQRRITKLAWVAAIAPVLFIIAGTPSALQAPLNPYDGGLTLTLSRFSSFSMLPYRDLWTLYGPGPPIYGSVIMHVFGRGTLPLRIGFVAVQAGLAVAVYLLARRYVARWVAVVLAVPIASITWSQFQFHFASSMLFVLWGTWFILRAEDDRTRTLRRAAIGAFLFGTSFWGRYEFVVLAVTLVLLTWWWLRPSLGAKGRWVLVAGLAPSAAFGVYLLGVVGTERVWLDLVEYPSRYYPHPDCRGLPTVWNRAWEALIAPFRGRLWTSYDVVLALGTFGPPLVGGGAIAVGAWRWRRRDAAGLAPVIAGLATMFVWIELRTRAGAEPDPVWASLMVSAAPLVALLRDRWIRAFVVGLFGAVILFTVVMSWAPVHLPAWTAWPPYHRVYGFADLDETFMFHPQKWERLTRVVHRYAGPDEPIFVALKRNTGHFANMAVLYWVVDRPPGSRYIGFAPCLTDRAEVQREIVEELADTDVIIQAAYFAKSAPPFASPSTVLDDYLLERRS
jgi:hypothetical protein